MFMERGVTGCNDCSLLGALGALQWAALGADLW